MDLENMPKRYFWSLELLWIVFGVWVGFKYAKRTDRNEWDV